MASYLKEFWSDKRILFLSLAFLVYLAGVVMTPFTYWTWIALAIGIVLFFFVEYFTHRYILHEFTRFMPKAVEGHIEHHNDPDNIEHMLTPNSYNVPLHVLFLVVFCLLTRSVNIGCAVMMGLGAYQLYYEWTHYISHRPIKPFTPWGLGMKKFHLLHHYKSGKYWYGVTNAIFDSAVGTNPNATMIQKTKDSASDSQINM